MGVIESPLDYEKTLIFLPCVETNVAQGIGKALRARHEVSRQKKRQVQQSIGGAIVFGKTAIKIVRMKQGKRSPLAVPPRLQVV